MTCANPVVIPKANFVIIQLAPLTGIQRWGCGRLKLERSGKKPDVFFFPPKTPYEDEREKDLQESNFPYYSSLHNSTTVANSVSRPKLHPCTLKMKKSTHRKVIPHGLVAQ